MLTIMHSSVHVHVHVCLLEYCIAVLTENSIECSFECIPGHFVGALWQRYVFQSCGIELYWLVMDLFE